MPRRAQQSYASFTFELQFHKKRSSKDGKYQISFIENNLRDFNALLNFYDIIKLLFAVKISFHRHLLLNISLLFLVRAFPPRHAVETT